METLLLSISVADGAGLGDAPSIPVTHPDPLRFLWGCVDAADDLQNYIFPYSPPWSSISRTLVYRPLPSP